MTGEFQSPPRTGRSIAAIVAGFFVVVILSIGTDGVLHATGLYPPMGQPVSDPLLVLATLYRTVYSVAGAYLTARFAPDRPLGHALVLGAIGFVLSIVGAVATWNRGPAFGPHWYPLTLVALAIPQCWLGGQLRLMQLRQSEGG